MAVVQVPCDTCRTAGGWMIPNPNGNGGMILFECPACKGKGWISRNV
jgi:hypothetical protein